MKSNRPALFLLASIGAAAPAQGQTPQGPTGFLSEPNALGKALDSVGRMEGLEKPLPCAPDATGKRPQKCYQGPTANDMKTLGLFGAFTEEFAPLNYGYGDYPYAYRGFGSRPTWQGGRSPR